MSTRIVTLLFAFIAACSGTSPQGGPAQPEATQVPPTVPDPREVPPRTNDPGAPYDKSAMQPSTPPPSENTGTPQNTGNKPEGTACLLGTECSSGVCEGEGCGDRSPGKCAPANRACTRDLRAYCGCDGKTFRGSGSCPMQRFAYRGECRAP